MIFCTGCGKELHETAPMCPHCGKPQKVRAAAQFADAGAKVGPLWAAITSLVLGILAVLAEISNSGADSDTTGGSALFAIVGLVLGIVSLNISKRGRGMAVAGIVTAVVGLCLCLSN